MKNNIAAYESDEVVKDYQEFDFLFPSESEILNFLKTNPNCNEMLDIGVGAGRTTKYFAPLFKKYIGVDYSTMMIDVCKRKFKNTVYDFEFGNATNLVKFPANSFDFVLFSFNGIDCVSIDDRGKVLNEMKRVCRQNGWIAFSSHSIYNARKLYSFQVPRNPLKYLEAYRRMKKVKNMNPDIIEVENADIIQLIDGDLDFTATYIYVKPEFQYRKLIELGFSDMHMYNNKGREINSEDFTGWKHQDAWIYFLCRNGR